MTPILILGIFILWMNLTAGHFQKSPCGNGVGYWTDAQAGIKPGAIYNCPAFGTAYRNVNNLEKFKLLIANLDFNK